MRSILALILIILLTNAILLSGCGNASKNATPPEQKFTKAKWDSIGDLHSYPERELILQDLITHHQIKGLSYHQLIDSLGEPDNTYYLAKDSMVYDITINYGYLDPKSGTYLAVGFNKDSIVTGFRVGYWYNRHVNEN